MNILLATSEAVPFAKTGGLADVSGALPVELARLGHRASVILPCYTHARQCGLPLDDTGVELSIPIGSKTVRGRILRSHLPDGDVPVYLVEQDEYFRRAGLYGQDGRDYIDNCERYVFFCRAVLEAIRLLELPVDILHANDWQTGLIPAYLKIEYRGVPGYEQIGSLYTIHNMAYQGQFWHWDMLLTGLDWKYFNWQQMEFFGHLNLMKTGLVFADALNTVSPRYAQEIQTPEFGCGLEGVLTQRREALSGIINGVDYREWDPEIDPHLARTYTPQTAAAGKAECKAALQQQMGLTVSPRTPLLAFVGRLAEQKGIDLIASVMQNWLDENVQWVVLGTGEPKYHQLFQQLSAQYPGRISARLEFSNPLAHRIEAGADLFLMPSRYEPCGLNQLYSLRYGTPPVVRATGGLSDTIVDANEATLSAGTATGFVLEEHTSQALSLALRRALDCYAQERVWSRLIGTGMRQDWSWRRSAEDYTRLYERIAGGTRRAVAHA